MSTADVGVLVGDQQESTATTTTRFDVFQEIKKLNDNCVRGGSPCASSRSPSLPDKQIGLQIKGIGEISLPISSRQGKVIKSTCWEVKNDSYKKVFQVEPEDITIQNRKWETALDSLVESVAYKLGVSPMDLSAELDMLLYMEKGSSMERCVNTEEEEDVFGTLYIQLPSVFSGGEINVYSGDDVNEFNLGGTGDNNLSCHFMCHYADCEYEMAKIKSGSRVLLRYSLHYFGGGEMPTTNMLKDVKPLTRLLELLPQNRKMIIVPVADDDCTPRCLKYDSSSLLNKGITALDDDNRANAELIKAAGGKSWKVLIVNAKMTWTETFSGCDCCGGHSDSYSEHAIVEVFDEEGNDVTDSMRWLNNVADFDCVSRRDFQGSIREENNGDAMLLGVKENNITYSSEGYSSNWGVCVSETETSTGYNSDTDYYGYGGGYDDHGHTKTQQYSGTFLLAYDTAAEVDLNCLGGVEGVSMVASKIVDTKDTCLLDRLLSTVETSKGKFNISSCQQLLEMMTTSTRRRDALSINNIDRINKILKGLSTSFEPSKELFEAILTAGDKFGHQNLSVSVLQLLTDTGRLRQHEITAFLCRVNFILELNKRPGNVFVLNQLCSYLYSTKLSIGILSPFCGYLLL